MTPVILDIETAWNPALEELALAQAREKNDAKKRGKLEDDELLVATRKDMALTPVYGLVCAVGFYANGDEPTVIVGEEKEVLDKAHQYIARLKGPFWVTFNGLDFDIPYLDVRAAVNRLPDFGISKAKYRIENHADIYQLITNWRGNRSSLLRMDRDTMCRVFGIETADTISSADLPQAFHDGDLEAVREHLKDDLVTTGKLWDVLGRVGAPMKMRRG